MKGLILAFLLALAQHALANGSPQYSVSVSCGPCNNNANNNCLSLNGGPFSTATSIGTQTCSQLANQVQFGIPSTTTFSCNTVCSGTCGISYAIGTYTSPNLCESSNGDSFESVMQAMNLIYAISVSSAGATYDWCGYAGCGSTNIAMIIGIVIGGVVGFALLIAVVSGTVRYCRKRMEGAYERKDRPEKEVEMI